MPDNNDSGPVGVTAADVTAQVVAKGQTITPQLATVVAQGLTAQGLTSETYAAGIAAVEGVKATGGSIAEQLAAGEEATGIPAGLTLVPGTTAYKEAVEAGVTVTPPPPTPEAPAPEAPTPEVGVSRVPPAVGPVTAADVIAQVEAMGQTITSGLAKQVASDLTQQGLTPAAYVAGVMAAQSYRATEGKKATPAGEMAAVQKAQSAVIIPAPPRILQISTVTEDTQERTGLPVGSHYATLEGGIIEPISDAEWAAKSKSYEAIQTRDSVSKPCVQCGYKEANLAFRDNRGPRSSPYNKSHSF